MIWTEKAVQQVIVSGRYRRNFVLTNYTPKDWWECDVFELTPARRWCEYEVKLTLADFKADAAKLKVDRWEKTSRSKHEELRQRLGPCPNRFYYVAPDGLLPLALIPEWAGLIEVRYGNDGQWFPHRAFERVVKRAPQLHQREMPAVAAGHPETVCYYRMHSLFLDLPFITEPP